MNDFAVKLDAARQRLPLRRLMEQYGKGPSNGNWKSFPKCPYCSNSKCAGVFSGKGSGSGERFKCHHSDCPTGTQHDKSAWDEIGFLQYELRLSRADASITFLKEAGVWQEAASHAPSIMPGKGARKNKLPLPPPSNTLPTPDTGVSPGPSTPQSDSSAASEPTTDNTLGELQPRTPEESQEAVGGETAVPGPPSELMETTAPPDSSTTVPGGATLSPTANDAPPPPANNIVALPGHKVPPGRGGGPPGNDGPPGGDDDGVLPSLKALRWFYARLQLSQSDREELWQRRGLIPSTCAVLGYRSNPKSNKELLLQMAEHFPPAVLVDCGLWSDPRRPGDKPAPNPQFYGMSLVEKRDLDGKKVKDEDGDTILECVWNHPILIPYFDERGGLIHLRPHKGMMREKAPRFYVARPSVVEQSDIKPVVAVITEGEFKAGALYQVLGPQAAIGSIPGITMAKPLFADIEEWLDSLGGLRQVVIAYDNEEKGDPKLPGFKSEEWKRYDSQVWARILARQIAKEGYDAKVCVLPKEWRDAKGKADWDGALANRLHAVNGHDPLTDPEQIWIHLSSKVREEWLKVLKSAQFIHDLWQTGLFDAKEERIIRNALERLSYEPKLPIGRDAEEAMSKRLLRLVAKLKGSRDWVPPWARGYLMMLAKRYQSLRGGYYILKPLREPQQLKWADLLSNASDRSDVEMKRACETALLGTPERISDFYMEAHYVLNRLNGTRDRLVRLHNIHGVSTPLVSLNSNAFAQPSKFREWLLNNIAGASWEAGERELQRLHADLGKEVSYKDVAELAIRGYHSDSKCWFFKDITFAPDCAEIRSDKSGIVWFDSQAYKMVDRDHENQSFRHGEPRMHPDIKAVDILKKWDAGLAVKTEEEAIQVMFQDVSLRMFQTIGNYAGWMILGTMFSFAAGPEIFHAFSGFPCLWVHGEPRQGKTSVTRWMMRIWGMPVATGLALKDSTKVGLSIALQQYGNLPVWLEEFQANAPEWMIEKLKNVYDRTSGSKKTFDEGDRQILAGVIVSGVATSVDTQLKSRFVHAQVAASNREGMPNHFDWFQDHADDFYLMGRYLMRRRKEFAKLVVEKIREWLKDETLKGMDERARVVHGAAYAGFYAMEALLSNATGQPSLRPKQLQEYGAWLAGHCGAAVREVQEQVNVDMFWRDLLDGLTADVFGETPSDRRRVFKVVEDHGAKSPVSEYQLRLGAEHAKYEWTSYLLYFRPGPVIDMLRRYKRSQGRDLPLDINDLRAQMRTRPYWVESKHDTHRQKFEGCGRVNQSCWCIRFDDHPLGRRELTDQEVEASLYRDGAPANGEFFSTEEWIDPRRGDLFALLDAIASNKKEPATA